MPSEARYYRRVESIAPRWGKATFAVEVSKSTKHTSSILEYCHKSTTHTKGRSLEEHIDFTAGILEDIGANAGWLVHRLHRRSVNKAGYTATPVACRWAGAVFEVI